jgi:NAD(P)H-dependent FMN reductase
MLTIICGTNRRQSMSSKVAQQALHIAQAHDIDVHLIDLSTIPNDFIHSEQYSPDTLPAWLKELQSQLLIPASHFLIISPEYNGSIPGYLKLFIDAISVHQLKESFANKHAALIGVASGRAGNLRGMDHLSSILHHINCHVVPGHLPISSVPKVVDTDGNMDQDTKQEIEKRIKKLMTY